MISIFRILNNQFELNNRMRDTGPSFYNRQEKTYKGIATIDEDGTLMIEHFWSAKVSCSCHPETCSHFGGTRTVSKGERLVVHENETSTLTDDLEGVNVEFKKKYLEGGITRAVIKKTI